MQPSALQILEGREVTKVEWVHDYAQITFGDDMGISVYNDFVITPENELSDLVGRTLSSIDEGERYFVFCFSGDVHLKIDLHPQASYGPEVLQFDRKGYPIVIMN